MEQKAGSIETRVTYPPALFSVVLLLALVAAVIHLYFGVLVYSGKNSIPMYGIAAVYIVGSVLVAGEKKTENVVEGWDGWGRALIFFLGSRPLLLKSAPSPTTHGILG